MEEKCTTCKGDGNIYISKSADKNERQICPTCRGTGEKNDNLSKVIPLQNFDLKK